MMLNFEIYTKDPDIAKKLLIGSLLALTGIGFITLSGWRLENIRRNIEEEDPFLAGWEDFGRYTLDGLRLILFNLVWYLPVTLLVIAMAVVVMVMAGAGATEDEIGLSVALLSFCSVGLTFVYVIPALILSLPAMGTLAQTDSVREALNPIKAYQTLKQNLGGFIIAGLLGSLGLSFLTSFGTLLCCIGIFPAYAIGYGVTGELYGKAYKEAVAKMEDLGDEQVLSEGQEF